MDRVLDGQHRLVMAKMAERLSLTDLLYEQGVVPSSYTIDVLRYDTPAWVLQLFSLQRALQSNTTIAYTSFHTLLCSAKQHVGLARLLGKGSNKLQEFVLHRLESESNADRAMCKDIARIVCMYPQEVMKELEYGNYT